MAVTESSLAAELVASYKDMDCSCQPSSFIIYSNDFKHIIKKLGYMCHRTLWDGDTYKLINADNVITAVNDASEAGIRFMNGLINGPFKNVSDKIELIKTEEGAYYLKCSKLGEWPTKLILNFCLATRIPFEHPSRFEIMNSLINAGVPFTLAVLFGGYEVDHPEADPWDWYIQDYSTDHKAGHHYFLDICADWGKVLRGDPFMDSPFYRDAPNKCWPSDCIWGSSTECRSLKGLTVREIYNKFKDSIHHDDENQS